LDVLLLDDDRFLGEGIGAELDLFGVLFQDAAIEDLAVRREDRRVEVLVRNRLGRDD
jgi:hypothetical protein